MFPSVWLHYNKFSRKYFLVFGKEEGKHKSRPVRSNQAKENATKTQQPNHQRRRVTKTQQNASNQAKETKTQQKKMNQQRPVWSSLVDRRAMRSSGRSRRSLIDERCDCPDDRTARSHRSRSSIAPLVGAVRLSDEWRDRRSVLSDLGFLFSYSLSDLGSLFSLSLSLFPEMNWSENEGEKSFRVKGENFGQQEAIFRKMKFTVTAKRLDLGENDFLKSFSPKTNAPLKTENMCLKTCVEIRVGKKVCRNTCNVV